MNIFLTGATGFIGRYTARRLAAGGHSVTCLVRNAARLDGVAALPGVRVVTGDLSDRRALAAAMRGCECAINLAGQYAMWHPDPASFTRANVDGLRNLLDAAVESGVGKFVHVSTVAVYGKPADRPFTEDSAPGPRLFSAYARSKAAGEALAWQACREQGLPLVVVYPGICLGAGDDRASGQYIRLVLFRRTPSTIFHHSPATYLHVCDAAEGIARAAEKPGNAGEKYLLGRETLTGRQYADLIRACGGMRLPPFRLPDPVVLAASYLFTGLSALTRRPPLWTLSVDAGWTLYHGFCFDGSKAERELGLRYTPVRQAMQEAVDWMRATAT